MTEIRVAAGWRDDLGEGGTSLAPHWSPQMQVRMAQAEFADAQAASREDAARRVRAEVWHERQVLAAAQEKAAEEGLPLRQALREVGHEPAEFIARRWAIADVQDAREEARRQAEVRRVLAQHGLFDDSANQPSEAAVEVAFERAVHDSPLGEEFVERRELETAGLALRTRFLRRQARGQL